MRGPEFRPTVFPMHERGQEKPAFTLTCEFCFALVENSKDGIDGHDLFHRELERRLEALEWVASRPHKIG